MTVSGSFERSGGLPRDNPYDGAVIGLDAVAAWSPVR